MAHPQHKDDCYTAFHILPQKQWDLFFFLTGQNDTSACNLLRNV